MAESSDETGGPAFPTGRIPDPNDTNRVLQRSGMTLRDYFAAHAPDHVTGFAVAELTVGQIVRIVGKERYSDAERLAARYALIAEASYGFADAMLAERARRS